jgi:hypothetical protein
MTDFLLLTDVIKAISEKLFPLPATERFQLRAIKQKIRTQTNGEPILETMQDADHAELAKFWSSTKLAPLPIDGYFSVDNSPVLKAYEDALNSKKWKLSWKPRFIYDSNFSSIRHDRSECFRGHSRVLLDRIRSGTLQVFDAYSALVNPDEEFFENLRIKRDDAVTYVKQCGFDLTGAVAMQTNESSAPWLMVNPQDPAQKFWWYTPARYFARQLVRGDPTLLTKKDMLAQKVSMSLFDTGIKKRGDLKPFGSSTILKAFTGIVFN